MCSWRSAERHRIKEKLTKAWINHRKSSHHAARSPCWIRHEQSLSGGRNAAQRERDGRLIAPMITNKLWIWNHQVRSQVTHTTGSGTWCWASFEFFHTDRFIAPVTSDMSCDVFAVASWSQNLSAFLFLFNKNDESQRQCQICELVNQNRPLCGTRKWLLYKLTFKMWLLKQNENSSVFISRLKLDSEVCDTVCKCKVRSSFQEKKLAIRFCTNYSKNRDKGQLEWCQWMNSYWLLMWERKALRRYTAEILKHLYIYSPF